MRKKMTYTKDEAKRDFLADRVAELKAKKELKAETARLENEYKELRRGKISGYIKGRSDKYREIKDKEKAARREGYQTARVTAARRAGKSRGSGISRSRSKRKVKYKPQKPEGVYNIYGERMW